MLKFSNIVGIGTTKEKDIQVVGEVDGGHVTLELPGKASAILSALFSAYACEFGVGGKEEKEHANLFVTGYELRQPKDAVLPLLLKCKPDLNLWFTIPVVALEDMGKALLAAAEIASQTNNEPQKS